MLTHSKQVLYYPPLALVRQAASTAKGDAHTTMVGLTRVCLVSCALNALFTPASPAANVRLVNMFDQAKTLISQGHVDRHSAEDYLGPLGQ